jgi:GNAT superfamily N-acetyltransferase
MIRQLPPTALSLTRDIAFSFFEESQLPGELNFDYWIGRWQSLIIELDMGVIFVYESEGKIKGILGGIAARCSMTGDLEAIEAFWYVYPEVRGKPASIKLLKAFEDWAKERGAARVKMMHLSILNPISMREIYLRMGYSPLESAYSKNL